MASRAHLELEENAPPPLGSSSHVLLPCLPYAVHLYVFGVGAGVGGVGIGVGGIGVGGGVALQLAKQFGYVSIDPETHWPFVRSHLYATAGLHVFPHCASVTPVGDLES